MFEGGSLVGLNKQICCSDALCKSQITNHIELKVFLDIQSKYTHKLLTPALSNKYFKVMFEHFIEKGTEFFEQDENVLKNVSTYNKEFSKLKCLFMAAHPTS